ncbi:MAG: hypothetical protein R3B68_08470 [Phycisphaerales bacterium]
MAKRTRKSPAPSERDAPASAPPKRTRTPKAPKAAAASGEPGAPTPPAPKPAPLAKPGKPSALIDTRVVYCGDCLEQLRKLPDGCVDLVYIDPPFNSNRNYEVFWGETKEKRSFEDRHAGRGA